MEFNVQLSRDPIMILDQVCILAKDKVVVSGDARRGRFTGIFDGNYSIDGNRASVHFTKKPIFISWSLVQKGLAYLAA